MTRIPLTENYLDSMLQGNKMASREGLKQLIKQLLDDNEKAKKHDKLIDDLNSRIESNKIQRQIEMDSEGGSKAFAYELEWGINLMSAILNYDFFKGRSYKELLKKINELESLFDTIFIDTTKEEIEEEMRKILHD